MDFDQQVIQKSEELPVVVDFWAPWCGPCRILGPVIEDLAAAANGKWALVKVNTDEQPGLMQKYKIRGIPAVKLFHQGKILAEFSGALPKFQIEKWLDQHVPTAEKLAFAKIEKQLHEHPDELEGLRSFMALYPDNEEAKLLMVKLTLFSHPSTAAQLIKEIRPGHPLFLKAEPLHHLLELMSLQTAGTIAVAEHLSNAMKAAGAADYDTLLQELVSAVQEDKTYLDELPRRATIAMFRWLGEGHELTKKYRRRFDMALY